MMPDGVISSEMDIPEEWVQNVKPTLSREDFGSELRYKNYLEVKRSLSKFQIVQDGNSEFVSESLNEKTEEFNDLEKWFESVKSHQMTVTLGTVVESTPDSGLLYYAEGENGGGYYYVYSPGYGEGSLSIKQT